MEHSKKGIGSRGINEPKKEETLWDQMIAKARTLNGEALLDMLGKVHPSDAYLLLRDHIDVHQIKEINSNDELKLKLAAIRKNSKEVWEHDHKTATMMDVDKACTQLYKMCLTLVKGINDGQTDVKDTINNIEKHLGLSQTDWAHTPDKVVEVQPVDVESNAKDEGAGTPEQS